MPNLMSRPCSNRGCPNVAGSDGLCPDCKRERDAVRDPLTLRWLNSKRYKVGRLSFLGRNPLCRSCLEKDGGITPATVLDHITPHGGDPALFWDASNWQALCKTCHDTKTTNERYHGANKKGRG